MHLCFCFYHLPVCLSHIHTRVLHSNRVEYFYMLVKAWILIPFIKRKLCHYIAHNKTVERKIYQAYKKLWFYSGSTGEMFLPFLKNKLSMNLKKSSGLSFNAMCIVFIKNGIIIHNLFALSLFLSLSFFHGSLFHLIKISFHIWMKQNSHSMSAKYKEDYDDDDEGTQKKCFCWGVKWE